MICTVDLPAFELNWTYYLLTIYLNFFSINTLVTLVQLHAYFNHTFTHTYILESHLRVYVHTHDPVLIWVWRILESSLIAAWLVTEFMVNVVLTVKLFRLIAPIMSIKIYLLVFKIFYSRFRSSFSPTGLCCIPTSSLTKCRSSAKATVSFSIPTMRRRDTQ